MESPRGTDLVDRGLNKPYVSDSFIFIHVPKTGGRWVVENGRRSGWWVEDGKGHAPPALVDPGMIRGRYIVGFVRHPISWLASWWCYYDRVRIPRYQVSRDHLMRRFNNQLREYRDLSQLDWMRLDLECFFCKPFEKFAERIARHVPNYWTILLDFYLPGADYVRKQESLKEELIELMDEFQEHDKIEDVRHWYGLVNATGSESRESTLPTRYVNTILEWNEPKMRELGYL